MWLSILLETISKDQAKKILAMEETQFLDHKSIEIRPAKLTKTISAFANTDGGDLYIGIAEMPGPSQLPCWSGFEKQEAANAHLQVFEDLFPLGTDFQYAFLQCDAEHGVVLHVQVNRTQEIMYASNSTAYIRRGSQSLPVKRGTEGFQRLEYSKGVTSFETESVNVSKDLLAESDTVKEFIRNVVPTSRPEPWLRKQVLLQGDRPTVAGVLLFADEPQALLPKHCGIKVYRYKTTEAEGFRNALAGTPATVEGCLYQQIRDAVKLTVEITEGIPKMGQEALEQIKYPKETLHEIITNAVLHRDYSIKDDIHIRVFDNRIEVQSPGKLPAHLTVKNILTERFARNGAIVRILNKFPDPPNQDVGEGLNTAFNAMHELGLKEPTITEHENSVLVIIKHEPLASPEEAIMEYLEHNETIRNRDARRITHIPADYRIKKIFGKMVDGKLIEQVPGTRTGGTAYRKYTGVDKASS